jgi:phenylalanyl-tRNA synthetase beta chain
VPYLGWLPDATFFPGRAAKIYYRPASGTAPSVGKSNVAVKVGAALSSVLPGLSSANDIDVGILGILHPSVLANFEIQYPCSAFELNLDLFKKEIVAVWEDEPTPVVPAGRQNS